MPCRGRRPIWNRNAHSRAGINENTVEVKALIPRKIRALISDLGKAGFVNRGGKGSHRNYEHPKGVRLTVSGQLGDDAKPYQEREVKKKIQEVEQ